MKQFQVGITLFWILLGFFVFAYSLRLGLGTFLKPGSGLFPFGLGLLVFFLAFYKLIKEFSQKGSEEEATEGEAAPSPHSLPLLKLAILAVALLGYALLLEPLGYIVATFLGMMVLFRIAGYKRWVLIVFYAACVTGVTYFGFTYLGTIFPPGILRYLGMH